MLSRDLANNPVGKQIEVTDNELCGLRVHYPVVPVREYHNNGIWVTCPIEGVA